MVDFRLKHNAILAMVIAIGFDSKTILKKVDVCACIKGIIGVARIVPIQIDRYDRNTIHNDVGPQTRSITRVSRCVKLDIYGVWMTIDEVEHGADQKFEIVCDIFLLVWAIHSNIHVDVVRFAASQASDVSCPGGQLLIPHHWAKAASYSLSLTHPPMTKAPVAFIIDTTTE